MIHHMKLNPAPFEMIQSGKKTFELRLFDEKRQLLQIGDTIVFTNTETGEALTARVIQLHRFPSFEKLFDTLPLLQCGYTEETVGRAHYSDMAQYYSADAQKKYGTLAIEITLI